MRFNTAGTRRLQHRNMSFLRDARQILSTCPHIVTCGERLLGSTKRITMALTYFRRVPSESGYILLNERECRTLIEKTGIEIFRGDKSTCELFGNR